MSSSAVLTAGSRPDGPEPTTRSEAVVSEPVSLPRVVASEWIKFRTLRSTWWVLGAAVVGMLLIALLVAYNTRHLTSNIQPDDAVPSAVLQGQHLAELLIGALGVLFISGEYGTGGIRSTFAAVPRRLPVLWAKLVVFALTALVSMVVVSVVAFLLAQAVISHYRTGYSLSDPGALRVVLGTGVYLTLSGVIGMALGWLLRSTPGALVAFVALNLVIPVIFGSVLGDWGKHVAEYLPSQAGNSFISSLPESPSLSPWAGLALVAAWAVALTGLAGFLLRRRDA